jgi:cytochrome c2
MFFERSTPNNANTSNKALLLAAIVLVIFALAVVESWLTAVIAGAPVLHPTAETAQAANAVEPGVAPVMGAVSTGDPANGAALFKAFQAKAGISCVSCHRADSEARLVGPGLFNIGARAASRVNGMSAKAYLRESIVAPGAYVVDGYGDVMPKTWAKVFTEQQLSDLVAYLMTLR